MDKNTNTLVKAPLSTQLVDILLDKILLLPPGSRIDTLKLKKEFGVSQAPIRDALRILSEQGLVKIVPRIGYFVASISKNEINDICELRMMLELYALEKGMKQVDRKKLERIRSELIKIKENKDFGLLESEKSLFYNLNEELHRGVIVESCKSKILIEFYLQILNRIRLVSRQAYLPYEDIEEHLKIIDCLLQQNKPLARESLKHHLKEVKKRTLVDCSCM